MSYTIVGLFPTQEKAKTVSEGLENTGFKNSDYIVYVNNNTQEKPSFWKRLFTDAIDTSVANTDALITSVAINNDVELQNAKNTFIQNGAVNIYEFQDMTLEEAKSLDYVKKVVELRAKTQIYAMPEISTSNSELSKGINSDINVGR